MSRLDDLTVKREQYKNHTIRIVYEEHADDPRKCWDVLGDWFEVRSRPDDAQALADHLIDFSEAEPYLKPCDNPTCYYCADPDYGPEDCDAAQETARMFALDALYYYVDAGRAMEGYGWCYCRKDKECNPGDEPDPAATIKALESEVQTVRDYREGNVYGWHVSGPHCDDACYGYYGDGEHAYMLQEARNAIDYATDCAAWRGLYDASQGD